LPSVSGFFISDFLWADQAVNQTMPFFRATFPARIRLAACCLCSLGYHRFLFFFLVRTVVIPSFAPYVKSDSPDSRLKSESFCCHGLAVGQIERVFRIATPHFRLFSQV